MPDIRAMKRTSELARGFGVPYDTIRYLIRNQRIKPTWEDGAGTYWWDAAAQEKVRRTLANMRPRRRPAAAASA